MGYWIAPEISFAIISMPFKYALTFFNFYELSDFKALVFVPYKIVIVRSAFLTTFSSFVLSSRVHIFRTVMICRSRDIFHIFELIWCRIILAQTFQFWMFVGALNWQTTTRVLSSCLCIEWVFLGVGLTTEIIKQCNSRTTRAA